MTQIKKSVDIGGKQLSFELGEIARQADGSTVVRMGDTIVLVTACAESGGREGIDFMPLTVDYRENTYAGGRIPGGFFKREGRPTEREILTCRVIDRSIRPLFPDGYRRETQVIAWVLSADGSDDPDMLGLSGASMSLAAAGSIPFETILAGVRVGMIDGEMILFPTHEERDRSSLDLVVAGTDDALVMVECGATEVDESTMIDALDLAHTEIRKIIAVQRAIVEELGVVKEPFEPEPDPWPDGFAQKVRADWTEPLRQALETRGKMAQKAAVNDVRDRALSSIPEENLDTHGPWLKKIFRTLTKEITRETILERRQRLDGRAFDEIRPVTCSAGVLPRAHGSALFTRGETQAMVSCTLGTWEDSQIIEAFEGESRQRFMLHYNFPPFSVGEARFLRGPGRREIGHGALARRALQPMVPGEKEEFPYTLRVVSDILESNGSSSMASVCGGSMAMMDAGVPMRSAVAGVAMGLVSDGERYAILSDIAGQEDHYGDMDFKVAGTAQGITALQMDIKVSGLSRQVLEEALQQAHRGRLHLLEVMADAIEAPRADISPYAPRITQIKVDVDQIRNIIGPGGKTIRMIVEETGARIDVSDDGTVQIATPDETAAAKAIKMIESLTKEAKVGDTYEGVVKRLEPYGAFVEILPNQDGLLHISEVALERIPDIRDVLTEGDKLQVRVINIDANDRIKLSRRVILEEEARERGEEIPERAPAPGGDRGDRGDRRGGRRDDRGGRGGRGGGGGRGGRRD